MNNPGFAESYQTYLSMRGSSREDPFVAEARRHVDGR
jgi:hypothetical protein